MNLLLALKSGRLLLFRIMNRPGRFVHPARPFEGYTIHCKNRAQTAPRRGAKGQEWGPRMGSRLVFQHYSPMGLNVSKPDMFKNKT